MTATMYGVPPVDDMSPRWIDPDDIPRISPFLPTFIPFKPDPFKLDPPPRYAATDELQAIAALEKLDEPARNRVLRYAINRWAPEPMKPVKAKRDRKERPL